jgi:hypothetical protein
LRHQHRFGPRQVAVNDGQSIPSDGRHETWDIDQIIQPARTLRRQHNARRRHFRRGDLHASSLASGVAIVTFDAIDWVIAPRREDAVSFRGARFVRAPHSRFPTRLGPEKPTRFAITVSQ